MADPGWNEALNEGGATSGMVRNAGSWLIEHWILGLCIAIGIIVVIVLIVWGITKTSSPTVNGYRNKYMAVPGAPEPVDISIAANTGAKARSGMVRSEADQKLREAVAS